jgi:hypothetical protein
MCLFFTIIGGPHQRSHSQDRVTQYSWSYFTAWDWDSPNLEGQVTVFISLRNRVAQLYPQALGSLSITSYDLQGCGGDIQTRLHTGFPYMNSARTLLRIQFPAVILFLCTYPLLQISRKGQILLAPLFRLSGIMLQYPVSEMLHFIQDTKRRTPIILSIIYHNIVAYRAVARQWICKQRPLLENGRNRLTQQQNCWERCSLCCPCIVNTRSQLYDVSKLRVQQLEASYLSLWAAVRQATAGEHLKPWIRKLRDLWHWQLLPDNDWWRHSRLRRLRMCCSELQMVWISFSTIVICSYVP